MAATWRINPKVDIAALHGQRCEVQISEQYVVLRNVKTGELHVLLQAVRAKAAPITQTRPDGTIPSPWPVVDDATFVTDGVTGGVTEGGEG